MNCHYWTVNRTVYHLLGSNQIALDVQNKCIIVQDHTYRLSKDKHIKMLINSLSRGVFTGLYSVFDWIQIR